MRKRLTGLLTATLLLTAFCGLAAADIFYTTSDYTSGQIGTISDFGIHSEAGFGGDTQAHSFAAGDKVLVTERPFTSDDSVYIYDPSDLSAPLANTSWAGIGNIYDVVHLNGYLYTITYGAKIAKINTADYTMANTYAYTSSSLPAGFSAKGVSLAELGGKIYALFIISDAAWPPVYQDSILVELDANLNKTDEKTDLPKNAHTLAVSGSTLYVASWGNAQIYGAAPADSLLQKIDTTNLADPATNILSAADLGGGQISSIAFADNGSLLVATNETQWGGYSVLVNAYLVPATLAPNGKITLKTGLTGWTTQTTYDPVSNTFWLLNSDGSNGLDQLLVFDATGVQIKSFSASDLGGPAYSLAAVQSIQRAGNNGGSGSGGGCTTGSFPLLALLAAAAAVLKRKSSIA